MIVAPAQHRPMIGVALAVAAGALLGIALPLHGWPFAILTLAALAAWAIPPVRPKNLLLLLAALFLSASNAALTILRENHRYLALQSLHQTRSQMTIVGSVLSEPEGIRLPHGGARLSFRFQIHSTLDPTNHTAIPLPARLLPMPIEVDFYVPESFLRPKSSPSVPVAGEGWTFTGKIRSRKVPFQATPIYSFQTSVEKTFYRTPSADPPQWRVALWELRRAVAQRLAIGIHDRPQEVAILRAVLLGYRSQVPDEVQALFQNSGTVHFFAISGLHILLIAQMLRHLLQRSGIPYRFQPLLLIPVLAAYTILTGARPSAIRACIMTSIYCAGTLFQRKPDPISSVATAAIALLWANPTQITDLGFLFSFSSVLSILLLASSLKTLFLNILQRLTPQPSQADLLAQTIAPPKSNPIKRLSRYLLTKLLLALPVSIAAWAAAEPITARVFGQMVPISILSNLFVIPLGEITVHCAVLGLLPGAFFPPLEAPFNQLAAFLVRSMIHLTGFFASLPGGHFETTPWPIPLVILWYLALLSSALLLHVAAARTPPDP